MLRKKQQSQESPERRQLQPAQTHQFFDPGTLAAAAVNTQVIITPSSRSVLLFISNCFFDTFRPSSRQGGEEISQLTRRRSQESLPGTPPAAEKRKESKERTDSLASSEMSFSAQHSPTKKLSKAFGVVVKVRQNFGQFI